MESHAADGLGAQKQEDLSTLDTGTDGAKNVAIAMSATASSVAVASVQSEAE